MIYNVVGIPPAAGVWILNFFRMHDAKWDHKMKPQIKNRNEKETKTIKLFILIDEMSQEWFNVNVKNE